MKENQKIRNAVVRHHGGLQAADESQIRTVWNSIDAETQKQYLAEPEPDHQPDQPEPDQPDHQPKHKER